MRRKTFFEQEYSLNYQQILPNANTPTTIAAKQKTLSLAEYLMKQITNPRFPCSPRILNSDNKEPHTAG